MEKRRFRKVWISAMGISLIVFAGAYFLWASFSGEEKVGSGDVPGADTSRSWNDLDIDIVASGEQLDSAEQNILENALEEDAESVGVIEESESGSQEQPDMSAQAGMAMSQAYSLLSAPIKKGGSKELRIGFVTDPHVESSGTGNARVLNEKFRNRLDYFIERMNDVFGADLLVANGDIIEGTKRTSETGQGELSLVKKIFDRTSIPAYWVLGNHDLRAVTKRQWKSALGIGYEYKAFDAKGYRIFILDSNYTSDDEDVAPGISYTRGKVSQEQIKWLEKELKKTKKKSIVFMHHPPLRNIDARINELLLKNALELRRIFSENGVLVVFSGHIEDLYYEESGGVRYFVLPGLVKHPDYQGTFAEISLNGEDIEVDVSYLKKDGTYRTIQMKQD